MKIDLVCGAASRLLIRFFNFLGFLERWGRLREAELDAINSLESVIKNLFVIH